MKVSFPHMGNYAFAFKGFFEMMGFTVLMPPPITKKTIELGFKHSPEMVCVPFKYNLGNYIEALDAGAEVIVQAGGGCRFGYYGEVQEEILRELGYNFKFLKLTNSFNVLVWARQIKEVLPSAKTKDILHSFAVLYTKCLYIENAEKYLRLNVGFEVQDGELERLFKGFLGEISSQKTIRSTRQVSKRWLRKIHDVKIQKPEKPLKVAIVGELYVVMEPYSNFFIEKELAKKGVEVHRFVTVTDIFHSSIFKHEKKHLKHAYPYLKYHIGAHGTESVGIINELRKQGFDGAIHIKPFGCMPEVNAMSALHKLSRENKFPVMFLSFDSQTSQTGIATRLDAFYDMIDMKRRKA